MNEKVFYNSKTRLIFLSILTLGTAIFFAAFAIPMATGAEMMVLGKFIMFISIFIVLLSVSFVLLKKTLTAEPAVIVNEEGITISGYVPGIGFIPWEEVDGCIAYSIKRQPMIGFILYYEEKFLDRFTGMKRKLLETNRAMGFPAINVPINNLKNKREFLEALNEQNITFYQEAEEPKERIGGK